MSKQLIIKLICDGEHDQQTTGIEEHQVTLDGGRVVEFAVCGTHATIIDSLRALMKNGAPVADPPKRKSAGPRGPYGTDLTCPMPGHEDYLAPSRTALGSHARSKHDMTLRELDAARGVST